MEKDKKDRAEMLFKRKWKTFTWSSGAGKIFLGGYAKLNFTIVLGCSCSTTANE